MLADWWVPLSEVVRNFGLLGAAIVGVVFGAMRVVAANRQSDAALRQAELARRGHVAELFNRLQLPTSSTSRRGGYSYGFDLRLDPIRLDHVGARKRLSTEEHDLEDSQQTVDSTGKDGDCKRLSSTLQTD